MQNYSRGAMRPSYAGIFRASEIRGRREDRVRAAPAVSCAKRTRKNAHEHTGSAETLRPSLRNGFTAYSELAPAIRICLSPSPHGLMVGPTPGWAGFASAGLDANPEAVRPTRFCRTLQRRSSARRSIAHGVDPALQPPARPTLPRPPHPLPNVCDDHDTPLCGPGHRWI